MAVPWVDPRAIQRAADMHAVYRMYDGQERLLYVGCTGNIGRRITEHALKRWFPLVDTIKLEWFPTQDAAYLAEVRAIRHEHPQYNKADREPPRGKPASAGARHRVPAPEGDCRAMLTALLANGTTAREVAMALGTSKWHARVRLEALRAEGTAKIEGSRRVAKWVLADAPDGGDAP